MGDIFTAGAEHRVAQANIEANRITQKSGNELSAAQSELQRFMANLGNKKAMDAAGKNIGTVTENIGRTLDAATTGRFSARIAAAEELGAMAAMGAAAGIGGSSVEAYNETLRLHAALNEEAADRAVNSQLIAQSEERGTILTDTVASFDRNIYSANLDFRRWADHKKASIGGSLLSLGAGIAVGFATGNPGLGMSVAQAGMGVNSGINAAKSGDFASANQHFTGALKNTVQVAKGAWQEAQTIKTQTRLVDDGAAQYKAGDFHIDRSTGSVSWEPRTRPSFGRSYGSTIFK